MSRRKHPALSLISLFEGLEANGVDPEKVLRRCNIKFDTLSASTYIDVNTELDIISKSLEEVSDPLFALKVGLSVKITSYSMYALMLLSAPNLKEVLEKSQKFQSLSLNLSELTIHYDGDEVEARSAIPDTHPHLKSYIADRDYAGNAVFMQEFSDEFDIRDAVLSCGIARPLPRSEHIAAYEEVLGQVPAFDQPYNWVRIPRSALSLPSKNSNPMAHRLFLIQAQEMVHKYHSDDDDLVSQIDFMLDGHCDNYPKLNEVAQFFNVSESTLRRQLSSQGTSYRALLESHRKKRALEMLDHSHFTISEVASRLGYVEPLSFFKVFKKWTGLTPKQYRRSRAV